MDSIPFPTLTKDAYYKKIGNTPLIKHESLSQETGRNIYFKAEWVNPGQSIKDRAMSFLLEDALNSGQVQPGGTLVESTGGNSGISLALLAKSYTPPFKVELFVPDVLIEDKVKLLEELGCTVHKCPFINVAPSDPRFFTTAGKLFAEKTKNCVYVDQMDNLSNRNAHYKTTGPEIWDALNGKIDGFASSVGTGGTFSGNASFFKDKSNGATQCWFADRVGSGLYGFFKSGGEAWGTDTTPSIVEGIGKWNLNGNIHDALTLGDNAVIITDREALLMVYQLIVDQDVWIGLSGGLNLCAAKLLALSLPEGSNVVTVVPDGADKYASKLFSKRWLQQSGHWDHIPVEQRKLASFDK